MRLESGVAGPGKVVLPVLLGAFSAFGVFAGTFAVLLADLSRALDLSPGPLGLALFAGAASSILAMAALGWTADRLGRRVFLTITGAVMGAGIVALASAGATQPSSPRSSSSRPRRDSTTSG
jgi:MFS family permease